MTEKDAQNGNNEDVEVEKKPGIVRKISKITFRIGPIKQEDLSTPELNKLMAMAQKFEITFDTIPILDSDQTDKLGYVTLPFEIRTQEYLLVLYDRLSNLKLNPARDVSAKFPEEFKKYVEEVRQVTAEQRKQKMEELRKKADYHKRSVYATFVDKDSGKDSLTEKFPDAKSVSVSQHNFQWYGIVEFDSQEKALEVMKANNNEIEIEGNKVKLVRTSPNPEDEKQKRAEMEYKGPPSMRPNRGGRGGGGGRQNRGGGGGGYNQSPKSLLSLPGGAGGGNKQGWKQGGKAKSMGGGQGGQGFRNQSGGGGGGRYQDYGGDYGGGYGGGRNQGFGGGNFNMGGKRKSDYSDFGGGQAKRQFNQRGGYGGGRGGNSGGGWNRF